MSKFIELDGIYVNSATINYFLRTTKNDMHVIVAQTNEECYEAFFFSKEDCEERFDKIISSLNFDIFSLLKTIFFNIAKVILAIIILYILAFLSVLCYSYFETDPQATIGLIAIILFFYFTYKYKKNLRSLKLKRIKHKNANW